MWLSAGLLAWGLTLRLAGLASRPFNADEFLVQPVVEVGQMIRIESELSEHGGVQTLDVERVFDGG